MNGFLENFGVFAIFFLVVCAYIKLLEYKEFNQSNFLEKDDVCNNVIDKDIENK